MASAAIACPRPIKRPRLSGPRDTTSTEASLLNEIGSYWQRDSFADVSKDAHSGHHAEAMSDDGASSEDGGDGEGGGGGGKGDGKESTAELFVLPYDPNDPQQSATTVSVLPLPGPDGTKAYRCPFPDCDFQTDRRWNLESHLNTLKHNPYNPGHVCPTCGVKFTRKGQLTRHVVRHTGERPYPCRFPGCEEQFARVDRRSRHEKTAHGEWEGPGKGAKEAGKATGGKKGQGSSEGQLPMEPTSAPTATAVNELGMEVEGSSPQQLNTEGAIVDPSSCADTSLISMSQSVENSLRQHLRTLQSQSMGQRYDDRGADEERDSEDHSAISPKPDSYLNGGFKSNKRPLPDATSDSLQESMAESALPGQSQSREIAIPITNTVSDVSAATSFIPLLTPPSVSAGAVSAAAYVQLIETLAQQLNAGTSDGALQGVGRIRTPGLEQLERQQPVRGAPIIPPALSIEIPSRITTPAPTVLDSVGIAPERISTPPVGAATVERGQVHFSIFADATGANPNPVASPKATSGGKDVGEVGNAIAAEEYSIHGGDGEFDESADVPHEADHDNGEGGPMDIDSTSDEMRHVVSLATSAAAAAAQVRMRRAQCIQDSAPTFPSTLVPSGEAIVVEVGESATAHYDASTEGTWVEVAGMTLFVTDNALEAAKENGMAFESDTLGTPVHGEEQNEPESRIGAGGKANDKGGSKQVCSICGQLCASKSALRVHMGVHDKTERPKLPCEMPGCFKSFYRKQDLRRHIRCHTNEKPYACSKCSMSFKRSDELKRHQVTPAGIATCTRTQLREDSQKSVEVVTEYRSKSTHATSNSQISTDAYASAALGAHPLFSGDLHEMPVEFLAATLNELSNGEHNRMASSLASALIARRFGGISGPIGVGQSYSQTESNSIRFHEGLHLGWHGGGAVGMEEEEESEMSNGESDRNSLRDDVLHKRSNGHITVERGQSGQSSEDDSEDEGGEDDEDDGGARDGSASGDDRTIISKNSGRLMDRVAPVSNGYHRTRKSRGKDSGPPEPGSMSPSFPSNEQLKLLLAAVSEVEKPDARTGRRVGVSRKLGSRKK